MVLIWFIEGEPACSPVQSRWHETNPAGGLRRVECNSAHYVTYGGSNQVANCVLSPEQTPDNRFEAPTGDNFLVVVDTDGTPSEATLIRIE